jgi:hypothetical protein
MRARDFLPEAKKARAHKDHVSTMPMSMIYPDMDPGYDYYRFMNVVAAHGHHKAPHDHDHFRDHPFASAYTDEEREMLDKSLKGLGHKTKWLTKEPGKEPESTQKNSPVPHNSGARRKKK